MSEQTDRRVALERDELYSRIDSLEEQLAANSDELAEIREQLKAEYKLETDYLRIRAYPFTREIHEFVAAHDRIYVIEQNRDAQMLSLLKLDLPPEDATKLRSVRHYNGLPIDARSVTDELVMQEGI